MHEPQHHIVRQRARVCDGFYGSSQLRWRGVFHPFFRKVLRSQVRCSYLFIPSAHHLTRNLSLPNTSPPIACISSSSTILRSPNTCSVPVYSTPTNDIHSSVQCTPILGTCSVSTTICTNASSVGSSPARFSLFALVILIRMPLMAPAAPDPHQVVLEQSSTSLRS